LDKATRAFAPDPKFCNQNPLFLHSLFELTEALPDVPKKKKSHIHSFQTRTRITPQDLLL